MIEFFFLLNSTLDFCYWETLHQTSDSKYQCVIVDRDGEYGGPLVMFTRDVSKVEILLNTDCPLALPMNINTTHLHTLFYDA